jgi:hypothetical protein
VNADIVKLPTQGKMATERLRILESRAASLVTPLGVVPLPTKPTLLRTPDDQPWDWAIMQLADDPAFTSGRLGIPGPARRRIAEIAKVGAEFDRLLIAHEVPKRKGFAEKPLELVAETVAARPALWAARLDRIVGLANKAAGAAVGTALSGLASLAADPVLIGAIDIPGGDEPLVAAFHLASWRN